MDLLFRDVSKVEQCIVDCQNGFLTMDYQCGHPFAFLNSIYVGEVCCCKVLYERKGKVTGWKELLNSFSPVYRRASMEKFLWECSFSLDCGRKSIAKQDILYAMGSIYRCINCLIQVWYSYNNLYCINEKGSLSRLQGEAAVLPEEWVESVENAISTVATDLAGAFLQVQQAYEITKRHVVEECAN